MTTFVGDIGVDAETRELSTPVAVGWRRGYARRVLMGDLIALCVAVGAALLLRFGPATAASTSGGLDMSYGAFGALLVVGWMLGLQLGGARDPRVIGSGFHEYRRVVSTTFYVFGLLSMASLAFKWDMSRGYLAIAFPAGLLGLVGGRRLWRAWLIAQRRRGRALTRVLLVGGLDSGREIVRRFAKASYAGMTPVGVWVPDGRASGVTELVTQDARMLPVLGDDASLEDALIELRPSLVIVTDPEHLGPRGLKDLAWTLDGSDAELMVAPNVVDVASGRLHLTEVASISLLHVDEPKYAAAAQWPKALFDRVMAVLLVVAFAPVLVATALAVKLTSRGPVFYTQERVGMNAEPFTIYKFRTMQVGADRMVDALSGRNESEVLFKIRRDPRVTGVGRFLRRFSLDEFPQLLNVIRGEMSLVGPRPPLANEVASYDEVAHRRLRVRPGLTGLWQVSGRSDLPWEEAIRLDTYYVANWSIVTDFIILARTARAIVLGRGAY